jgi:hypothetical protein
LVQKFVGDVGDTEKALWMSKAQRNRGTHETGKLGDIDCWDKAVGNIVIA